MPSAPFIQAPVMRFAFKRHARTSPADFRSPTFLPGRGLHRMFTGRAPISLPSAVPQSKPIIHLPGYTPPRMLIIPGPGQIVWNARLRLRADVERDLALAIMATRLAEQTARRNVDPRLVRDFQRKIGVQVTGWLDPATQTKVDALRAK